MFFRLYMIDIVYILIILILFLACWGLLVLCQRLMEK
jgi:hypothetical protein